MFYSYDLFHLLQWFEYIVLEIHSKIMDNCVLKIKLDGLYFYFDVVSINKEVLQNFLYWKYIVFEYLEDTTFDIP